MIASQAGRPGAAGFHSVWPDSPGNAEYRTVQPGAVETLLVGGELDFSAPPVNATNELVPGLGHTHDAWERRPEAGKHLPTTFFDAGHVDRTQFDRRPVALDAVPLSMSTVAALLIGVPAGGVLIGVLVLGLLLAGACVAARPVARRTGGSGR